MATLPFVSIITVNYNQTAVTCDLLDSLTVSVTCFSQFEIIVVDNGSQHSCEPVINRNYPHVRVVSSETNLGSAGGVNLGLRIARGDYFMLLDNDTKVSPDFLLPLVNAMQQHPDVGICAAKIRSYEKPEYIQFAGSTPLHPLRMAPQLIGNGHKDEGQFDQEGYTHHVHGAALLVRREAVNRAGVMPEEYFLYYQEVEWCERIKQAGFRIYFVPESVVYHKGSVSLSKTSAFQVYYKTRNRILLARRWRRGPGRWVTLSYLCLITFRDILAYTYAGKIPQRVGCWEAVKWHLVNR
ncbi:glycosyltransferase family 2 protein [Arsenicibacter rosenii]|uniref:Glycosyltransferase 2-like domain-containing protein n=1 Tax=Arsenicibacter rosenii TaxID=1750698 RepID=A0A1S2VLJ1_9BACT|nr:glycosyltransferase family 2 protein [Arsenicibacter rosenii]OIN59280.1 hypothetical protein BLX24_09845 [Arsenicibacter rosenii]